MTRWHWRIIQDEFAGYEVQWWIWWWPFWCQWYKNTHRTLDAARAYAVRRIQRKVYEVGP